MIPAPSDDRSGLRRIKDYVHARLGANISFPLPLGHTRFIKAVFEPTNLALYEQLLAPGMRMPRTPRVQLEFLEATPGWREASFNLACRYGDQEGWLGLYWPIDSYLGYKLGRLVGYPKHLAQVMAFESDVHGAHAQVVHRGRTELALDFTRGSSASSTSQALAADIVGPERERPHFLQVPPGRGTSINRLTFHETKPLVTEFELGTVSLRVDVDAAWTALLPKDGMLESAKLIERTGRGFGWLIAKRVSTDASMN